MADKKLNPRHFHNSGLLRSAALTTGVEQPQPLPTNSNNNNMTIQIGLQCLNEAAGLAAANVTSAPGNNLLGGGGKTKRTNSIGLLDEDGDECQSGAGGDDMNRKLYEVSGYQPIKIFTVKLLFFDVHFGSYCD